MASIDFYISTGSDYNLMGAGSGLGFYGSSGFGASVAVGAYQGSTFVTDGTGATQGPQAQNVTYLNTGSGTLAGGSGVGLKAIPNYQSTVNMRFTHTTAVKAQTVRVRGYDRSGINNNPSGVTFKAAEIIHPASVQGPTGSGDDTWVTPAGSGTILSLANSPGASGLWAGDGVGTVSTRKATRHDWYMALSASPDTIGSKTQFGLYASLEYL
jgi:hypothetical protein